MAIRVRSLLETVVWYLPRMEATPTTVRTANRGRTNAALAAVVLAFAARAAPAGPDNWQAIVLHPLGTHSWAYGTGAQMQVGVVGTRAVVWNGQPGSTLLPIPEGYTLSESRGIDGQRIVGHASLPIPGTYLGRAMLWPGAAQMPINLHPDAARHSVGHGVAGDQQVGHTYFEDGNARAALWRGSAESFVRLDPRTFGSSYAFATDGVRQGGTINTGSEGLAVIWDGAAWPYVTLNPPGSTKAEVRGMAEGVQVGFARLPGQSNPYAALWRGTAESYINMNPTGSTWSEILATKGQYHVGRAWFASLSDAVLWLGDEPNNYVNLHHLLPPSYSISTATGVFVDGETIYVSGYAWGQGYQAVLWIGTIPAPSAAVVLAAGLGLLARRRRV
jgi:hypothetical protein